MAEFKLGRIRFIWKNNWSSSTIYYKDDIVRNGGNTYVCIAGHTAPTLFTDSQSTYWQKISDGVEWKGDWSVTSYYKVNDIVKYGGYLYIANTAHTSTDSPTLGLENDQSKWDLFAEGFDYKADWTINTRYKINDIAKYNGTIYICTAEHTSALTTADGLEVDQAKWDIFSEGFYWTDVWEVSNRYRVNDIVRFGGTLYICNTGHTSAATEAEGLEADQAKWDYLHKGIEYKSDWATATRYKINDVVKYGGGVWICTTFHTSTTSLAADEANWAQFVEGLEFEDSWNASANYQPGDFVTYGGYSYVAVTNNIGLKPSDNDAEWDLFTTGFRFIGDYEDDSTNREYIEGDVVRLGGYTYLCIEKHEGQRPPNPTYWQRLNEGIEWKGDWTDATFYDAGDSIQYGVNSYICVLAHTSDETVLQNRPDQDVDGSEWNLLVAGAEAGNLTTEGDIVYYGGAGPTRLGVGTAGQVLKVNDAADAPEWTSFGAINNVFYVETNGGVDEPAPSYGVTLDRPFKTVRYATEQVQAGAIRYNAKTLLERNRSFIQDEVIEYIDATYPLLTYDAVKCRRDTGQVLDAVIWDLSHGGNERSRLAALSYFNEAGDTYLADNATETADGLGYIVTLADAIMSNVAPVTVRGSLNQYTNVALVEEADALSTVTALTAIVTAAITAGNTTGIPAERKPQNSIFVKTGNFSEVLPIIVPENTAVIGDELRSTRISPAGALVDSADTPYTLDAIDRLKTIMSAIVTAPGTVVKTTGNLLDPVTTSPVGSAGAGAFAAELWQQIYDYIDFGVNGASGDSTVPVTYGSNTPNTTTDYTYAVESIEANRAFLLAEVTAYIADTYGAYVYDAAACERDVSRYIDAIKHDLIYTGNYKSLLYARYYVNAVNSSVQEDMFYMRNGTGLRNCTVNGLTGTLGSANAYGTKRPSAGAFVSLDPGWGPAHTDAWIINKSPYVQNVTTFGTGCVGCKIDGDLHDGGNDSIVANDFTQIISDGIGVWCTNLGRTELVSVFSYYGHIGYLAENGGKIRATNGNSSYGTFGTVAEGVDVTEVPVTGTINNRAYEAQIDLVQTNAAKILGIEYDNAGTNYTTENNVFTFTNGAGVNTTGDEIRDGAVYEVRMLTAGADYGFAESYAQTGTATSITLSATDGAGSADYVGMTVYIKGGKGVGQYGKIATFDSGTKIATVVDFYGNAGWNNIVYGTATQTSLDLTTLYQIEPTATFTSPTFSTSATGLTVSSAHQDIASYGDTVVVIGGTSTQVSVDGGANWAAGGALPASMGQIAVGKIGGTTYWVTIPADSGASTAAAYSTNNGTSWNAMTLPANVIWESIGFGVDKFMAVARTGETATSTNGNTWTGATALATPNDGSGYQGVAHGAGKWVAIASNTSTDSSYYSIDSGTTWIACTMPSQTDGYRDVTFGNNIWVVAGNNDQLAYSPDGITFTDNVSTLGAVSQIGYGQGLFVAQGFDGANYQIKTSEDGVNWTSRTSQTDEGYVWTFVAHSTAGPTWVGATTSATANAAKFSNITTARGRVRPTSAGEIAKVTILEPGSGYTSAPTLTFIDPANTVEATVTVRIGDGALAQPTFNARGSGYTSSTATVEGDGYRDQYQIGGFINVAGLTSIPVAGSNVEINDDGDIYKLVTVTELLGSGPYTARLQISPTMSIVNAPEHGESLEIRIRYSQVRLTGHDFLDIGTGNFTDTNYPGTPVYAPVQANEAVEGGGGRVFYTSTDQDGNFRVGDLFSVEQATGSSTLNADAFNLAGLQELQLGSVALGSSNTSISEFSTDGTFAANSDNIVPTQKAIRTYLEGQIGGGGSSLNVNKLTAGVVEISSNSITSTGNVPIDINTKVKFKGGIDGAPLALNYFLLR